MNTFAGIGVYCNPDSKTHGDTRVMQFSLGIRRNKDVTDWLVCKAFNNQHDFAKEYIKDKTKIGVQGKLQEEKWTSDDGTKHRRHVLVVNQFTLCAGRNDDESPAPSRRAPATQPQHDDDEIPF